MLHFNRLLRLLESIHAPFRVGKARQWRKYEVECIQYTCLEIPPLLLGSTERTPRQYQWPHSDSFRVKALACGLLM
jgi:hypothetical protein